MRGAWKAIGVAIASIVALAALSPPPATAGDRGPSGRLRHGPPTVPTRTATPTRVPQAPESPACTPHFCVHWVAETRDAPKLTDLNGLDDGDGVPDYVEQVQEVAEHTYEIQNEKLGWRDPRSDGRQGGAVHKTDVYLAQIGGSLFGYAAPDRGQGGGDGRLPRHLHGYLVLDNDYDPFEFPGHEAARGPPGHLRPRVQPHPPVRLRRLPGRLVRGVDRDLDGGPGLQRHQRLPALRATLDPPLRDADHGDRDPRVRLRRLESLADPSLRPLDRAQGLGGSGPRQARAASRSPPTTARYAPPAARTSTATSRASAATWPSGARARSSARATSTSTCRAREG